MNIEAYDLDLLRKIVRDLQKENRELRLLLDKKEIPYNNSAVFSDTPSESAEYDLDQGARISHQSINEHLARRFYSMFWGRTDVFAKRAKNGNYYPQCMNRWDNEKCPKQRNEKKYCEDCEHQCWVNLSSEIIAKHLLGYREDGTDVIGVYPLFPDGTCRFLVFDFDNHEKEAEKSDFSNENEDWHDEVDALRLICKQNGIDALVERSRSGKGAHVWIFFKNPIPASIARNFGFLLLDKGAATINLKTFRYYDRMYPSQDAANTIGNLIALPLQGQALKSGNSAFVDENWNAYPDQWGKLFQTRKLEQEEIEGKISKWQEELSRQTKYPDFMKEKNRLKPWKRKNSFVASDVTGKLHIVLADGIYVDALNLAPRLQNQIRCMATFDNPIYYKNKRLGYSNYYNFSMIYMGEDIEGYIKVPRGMLEDLIDECEKSGILYDVEDQREKGRPIRAAFKGELRVQQDLAVQQLLAYDHGILSAATAFGKTVVCSYLIAKRKVNTLILLENTSLISQWEEELGKFLLIDEEPPEYQTKSGRVKVRDSVIGTLKGRKDTLTGIVDIAMIGSLYKKGNFHEKLNTYGMVIMDECHHAASVTAQEILKKVNAKYVVGVSATPMRSDKLEKINYMLLGPVRHQYTALEQAQQQGLEHLVIPRYTRVVGDFSAKEINQAYQTISSNEMRNQQILEDIQACISNGRTPVVLTKYKEHAKYLYEHAQHYADHVFLFYGDNTNKQNESIRKQMKEVPRGDSMLLIATGSKIGEGFDLARLDTLMLASPVSYAGLLTQYAGRANRSYEGKQDVRVYDYIDSHIKVFQDMYLKRLRAYKKIGYKIFSDELHEKQDANAIYDSTNYADVFERDLIEAEKEIVIFSPKLRQDKVGRFIRVIKPRQEAGVKITVITEEPENSLFENALVAQLLIEEMKKIGIHVKIAENDEAHYAVIDEVLVWHGGINLLGKEDAWDNLIRVKDRKAASELLLMAYK